MQENSKTETENSGREDGEKEEKNWEPETVTRSLGNSAHHNRLREITFPHTHKHRHRLTHTRGAKSRCVRQ